MQELTADKNKDAGREKEVGNALSIALKSLLARIERGMTIEIRYLPEPQSDDEDDSENTPDPLKAVRDRLEEITEQLRFPDPNATPLVQLPRTPDDKKTTPNTKKAN